jgi:hypothetical protein
MTADGSGLSPALRGDPLADATIAAILGPWNDAGPAAPQWQTIAQLNAEIGAWTDNAALANWRPAAATPPSVAAALRAFIDAAGALPDWADPQKIARAETLFMDISLMSCTLLFCASLPECYVIPDLAGVLHVAGQLEQRADYRIRSTAAMLFPVMMRGGLTTSAGGGVAQTLKVRLIHATIRHLMLRGDPATVSLDTVIVARMPEGPGMHKALYASGWNVARDGLPCSQQELAYTLLTFGYVFLRGLRRLGIGLAHADEEAYLHAWNVTGHVLGIERALMPASMREAKALFAAMQAQGRASSYAPDPRPALAGALMAVMQNEIPFPRLKGIPVLMTRRLCGRATARDLGLSGRVSLLSRFVFSAAMLIARAVDGVARLFVPDFSLSRLIGRLVGYQLMTRLLMDQTRPLKLPDALLNQVDATAQAWRADPKAPRWVNRLEARLTANHRHLARGGKTS